MTTTSIFHVGQRLTDGVNVDVLVKRVASGGMGDVAMGPNQGNEGRWSAIKVLKPDLLERLGHQPGSAAYADAEARLRGNFIHEALTWRGLWPHRNLLTAEFVTQINGELALVLDYAEQGSLRDYFNDNRRQGSWLTLDTALRLAQEVAAGLVALHTPTPALLRPDPIVHRDLKPENILLSHGYTMITDFGLAKLVAEAVSTASDATAGPHSAEAASGSAARRATLWETPLVATLTQVYHTRRGEVLGTPAYMAPEQWQDASQAGTAADAYAFGLIVCELLTGRHPLLALDDPRLTLDDCRQAHLAGRPMPLRQLGVDTFANEHAAHDVAWGARQDAALGQVEALVAKLLAKLEAARPTAAEALAALQAAAVTLGERPPYTPPDDFYTPTEEHERVFWLGWAAAYARFDLYDLALLRIEQALQLAPEDPMLLNTYANILAGLGRVEEAQVVQRQALERLPAEDHQGRAGVWSNIGIDLTKQGRYAEAEAAYDEALRLDPTISDVWAMQAANAGQWADAEEVAGRVEAARARVEAGLKYIAQALRLNPDHPKHRQVAQVLLQYREELRRQG